MDNFDLRKYLAEGKINENRYDIDDPNSPLGKLNDNDKDVVVMWLTSGESPKYLNENKDNG